MSFMKNRTTVGIICIVLSLVICFGVTPMFNEGLKEKTTVVRVAKEIKMGAQITKDMITIVEVGSYNLPENAIRDKDAVIGNYATADLAVGDYILPPKLTDIPTVENAYLYSLTGEKQAMSVTVKYFANGLSGKLKSGDVVSIIAPDFRETGVTEIPPELQYVEVIAVTANTGYDTNQRDAGQYGTTVQEDEEKELPATVTLLVTPSQSKILAELEAVGKLHLSLVYRGDKENSARFIDEQEQINKELAVLVTAEGELVSSVEDTSAEGE